MKKASAVWAGILIVSLEFFWPALINAQSSDWRDIRQGHSIFKMVTAINPICWWWKTAHGSMKPGKVREGSISSVVQAVIRVSRGQNPSESRTPGKNQPHGRCLNWRIMGRKSFNLSLMARWTTEEIFVSSDGGGLNLIWEILNLKELKSECWPKVS